MLRWIALTGVCAVLAAGCAAGVDQASVSGSPTPHQAPTTTTTVATAPVASSTTTPRADSAVTVADRPPLFAQSPTPGDPASIVVMGDSVTYELAPAILAASDALGAVQASNRTQVGLGLSRHDSFVWWDAWAPMIDELRPDVVVMQVGIWDVAEVLTGALRDPMPEDPDWAVAYGALMDRAVDVFSEHGAHVYWLEMLPSPDPAVAEQMNDAVRSLAARDDRVTMIPMDEAFTDDGTYITEIDSILGPLPIRKVDDVHVCRTGAMLAATEVGAALSYDFGLETAAGWEFGSWRLDPRYDVDPCPDAA